MEKRKKIFILSDKKIVIMMKIDLKLKI